MEDLFYQFYDILIIVIAIVFLYSSIKKGISKTFLTASGYILSFFIASKVSSMMGEPVYLKLIQKNNIEIIYEKVSELDFSRQYKIYIDSLGYDVTADTAQLEKIFKDGTDITKKTYQYMDSLKKDFDDENQFAEKFENGYYSVLLDTLKADIPSFVLKNPDFSRQQFDENIKMMYNEDAMLNAFYIEKNFTKASSVSFIEDILFIIIMIIIMIIVSIVSDYLKLIPEFGIIDHTLGIIPGLVETAAVMIIVVGIVKILVNTGSNEMILFNTTTIEQTEIFKYIYYDLEIKFM